MNLSHSILVFELKKRFHIQASTGTEEARYLSPFLFSSGASQPGRVYVFSTGDNLPASIPPSSLLLCPADVKQSSVNVYAYPIVFTDASGASELLNAVQEIYEKYENWVKGMNDILTEGRNALQRILSLSAEVHQNMFLVQDAGFVTVALAWRGSFGAGKAWDSSALKASIGRSMSPGEMERIKDYFPTRRAQRHAMRHKLSYVETIDVPLYDGDLYQGMLSMLPYNRDFDQQDYAIVEFLGAYAAHALSREAPLQEEEGGSLATVFSTLIHAQFVERKRVRQICEAVGFRQGDRFVVAAIPFKTSNSAAYIKYIQQELSAVVPGSALCQTEGTLAVVINTSLQSNGGNRWQKKLAECIGEFDLQGGISDEFTDFMHCMAYYKEAVAALSLIPSSSEPGLYFFRNVRAAFALKNSTGGLMPEMLYSEGFKRVLEYDKTASVSYLETLRVLLEENLSISRTARRLYISRNTFLARYDRLKAVLQEDLTDPDVRFYLEYSLRLYEQQL